MAPTDDQAGSNKLTYKKDVKNWLKCAFCEEKHFQNIQKLWENRATYAHFGHKDILMVF